MSAIVSTLQWVVIDMSHLSSWPSYNCLPFLVQVILMSANFNTARFSARSNKYTIMSPSYYLIESIFTIVFPSSHASTSLLEWWIWTGVLPIIVFLSSHTSKSLLWWHTCFSLSYKSFRCHIQSRPPYPCVLATIVFLSSHPSKSLLQ